jgi:hypothetical protein
LTKIERIDAISPEPEVHRKSLSASIPILASRISELDAALREVIDSLSGPAQRLRKAADMVTVACNNLSDDEPCAVIFAVNCLAQTLDDKSLTERAT